MNGYLCPVCSYRGLEHPPQDFTICPCCGTEFGLDDFAMFPEGTKRAWQELRRVWLENGGPWFDPGTPQPLGWDPLRQIWEEKDTLAVTSSVSDVSSSVLPKTITTFLTVPLRVEYA